MKPQLYIVLFRNIQDYDDLHAIKRVFENGVKIGPRWWQFSQIGIWTPDTGDHKGGPKI